MNALKLPREQIAALRAEDLQLYLSSRGWQPDADASTELATFYRLPSEPDAEILVPRHREIADYVPRMADAAQVLAAVEQRSIWTVLNDLANPPADTLRLRVLSPEAASGSLPLAEGLRLLRGGHDLLLAAAHSVHQRQAYYPRQSVAEAVDFVRSCRIGQTERGSYVAAILAPVPPNLTPSLLDALDGEDGVADEPFERRATLSLMEALQHIQTAIELGKPDNILGGIQQGVSANLCEALALVAPENPQASVEVSVSWSRSRPHVPQRIRGQVSFAQGEFSVIREAARRLREGVAARRERVQGPVISLHAEPAQLFGEFQGRVIVRAEVSGRLQRVRVVLSQAEYVRACDAHRDGQRIETTAAPYGTYKSYKSHA